MLNVRFLVRDFDLWCHKQKGPFSYDSARYYEDDKSPDTRNDFGDFRKGVDGGGAGQRAGCVFRRLRPKQIPTLPFLFADVKKKG